MTGILRVASLRGVILTALLVVAASFSSTQAQSHQPVPLEADSPLEASFENGADRHYRLHLNFNDYLQVAVEQKGVDVVVRLLGPQENTLLEVDSPTGTHGVELLQWIAESSGDYRIIVSAFDGGADQGTYSLHVEELRPAQEADRQRLLSLDLLRKARELSRGQPGQRQEGLVKYQQAAMLFEELKDWKRLSLARLQRGYAWAAMGNYEEALRDHRLALQAAVRAPDLGRQARAYYGIGFDLGSLNRRPEAIESLNTALQLYRELGALRSVSNVLNSLAVEYGEMGQPDRAIALYQESFEIAKGLGLQRVQATALTNLGLSLWATGETDRALASFDRALPLARRSGDAASQANLLTNRGLALWSVGARSQAIDSFERSIDLWIESGGYRENRLTALTNLGSAYQQSGQTNRAAGIFRQALQLSRQLGDKVREAHVLRNMGFAALTNETPHEASRHFQYALNLSRQLKRPLDEAVALRGLGRAEMDAGQLETARRHLEQSLAASESLGDHRGRASTLTALARLNRTQQRIADALRAVEAALSVIEAQRLKVSSHDLRATFLSVHQEAYRLYLDLLWDWETLHPGGDATSKAWIGVELRHARTLLDLVQESRNGGNTLTDPQLQTESLANHLQLSRLRSRWSRSANSPERSESVLHDFEAERRRLEDQRRDIERRIRRRHPRLAEFHQPRILDLQAARRSLDSKSVVLQYAQGLDSTYLLALSAEKSLFARLAKTVRLEESIDDLRNLMEIPNRRSYGAFRRLSEELHRLLIAPADSLLAGKRRLVIIPSGRLLALPFEALSAPNSSRPGFGGLDYLVRRYQISYSPSMTVRAALENLRSDAPSSQDQLEWVAFGDPAYPRDSDRLPQSRRETKAISDFFPPSSTALYLGDEAREENVKNNPLVSRARRLHFAVHGRLRQDRPYNSALALSRASDSPEDGLLQVYEIIDLNLTADLVVLSACETALGRYLQGEGVLGLSRAFLYAGAKQVAVSLWSISDRATAEQMKAFYSRLAQGDGSTAALRKAKLQLIESGVYSHPYYWAPFIVFGG